MTAAISRFTSAICSLINVIEGSLSDFKSVEVVFGNASDAHADNPALQIGDTVDLVGEVGRRHDARDRGGYIGDHGNTAEKPHGPANPSCPAEQEFLRSASPLVAREMTW